MGIEAWLAVGAIVLSLLLAGAGWLASTRHTERDDLLQDLDLLDRLSDSAAKDALRSSIDYRVFWLAHLSERRRKLYLVWAGLAALLLGGMLVLIDSVDADAWTSSSLLGTIGAILIGGSFGMMLLGAQLYPRKELATPPHPQAAAGGGEQPPKPPPAPQP